MPSRVLTRIAVALCALGPSACELPLDPGQEPGETDSVYLTGASAPGSGWTLVDLRIPHSTAFDINNKRQVVGTAQVYGSSRGFLWSDGTTTWLGDFQPKHITNAELIVGHLNGRPAVWKNGIGQVLFSRTGYARDVNDDGVIVGSYGSGFSERPFMWEDGSLHVFPFRGRAMAISNDGVISGLATGPGVYGPWVHSSSGLSYGSTGSDVRGVDDYRRAVLESDSPALGCPTLRWVKPGTSYDYAANICAEHEHTNTRGHVITNWPLASGSSTMRARMFVSPWSSLALDGLNGSGSLAYDLNDGARPWATGTSERTGAGWMAVVWKYTEGGAPSMLPRSWGAIAATGSDINDNGDVSGSQNFGTMHRAALWRRN